MTMAIAATVGSGSAEKEMYKDPSVPVKDRVEDLLSRMTLEEKVGQMNQFVGIEHIKANSAVMTADELKNNTANAFYPGVTDKDVERWTAQGPSSVLFLHVLTIEETNHLQSLAMKKPPANSYYFLVSMPFTAMQMLPITRFIRLI